MNVNNPSNLHGTIDTPESILMKMFPSEDNVMQDTIGVYNLEKNEHAGMIF